MTPTLTQLLHITLPRSALAQAVARLSATLLPETPLRVRVLASSRSDPRRLRERMRAG